MYSKRAGLNFSNNFPIGDYDSSIQHVKGQKTLVFIFRCFSTLKTLLGSSPLQNRPQESPLKPPLPLPFPVGISGTCASPPVTAQTFPPLTKCIFL